MDTKGFAVYRIVGQPMSEDASQLPVNVTLLAQAGISSPIDSVLQKFIEFKLQKKVYCLFVKFVGFF